VYEKLPPEVTVPCWVERSRDADGADFTVAERETDAPVAWSETTSVATEPSGGLGVPLTTLKSKYIDSETPAAIYPNVWLSAVPGG
jgi:hypothetical protein